MASAITRGAELRTEAMDLGFVELRAEYLASLAALSATTGSLRAVVEALIRRGVRRRTLVRWGIEGGYSESYVRSVLSKLLCARQMRERKEGAGRRVPREALELLGIARRQYGERAAKFLLAAYRAAKARRAGGKVEDGFNCATETPANCATEMGSNCVTETGANCATE
jgi:hypothetical protein